MTHDQLRKNHFARLNAYVPSKEYAEYAKEIGTDVPQGEPPSLIGDRWEIDEDIYHEFLEMLPPMGWRGGTFYISEFSFGDITAKFTHEGGKYFCEFAHFPERKVSRTVLTPWGVADSITEIAPGIVSYSTPSHGGYWLSPERVAEMPKPLREFKPWAGPGWFEEDCDWSVVALAFPQYFPEDAVRAANATFSRYKPELYKQLEDELTARPPTKINAVTIQQSEEEKTR